MSYSKTLIEYHTVVRFVWLNKNMVDNRGFTVQDHHTCCSFCETFRIHVPQFFGFPIEEDMNYVCGFSFTHLWPTLCSSYSALSRQAKIRTNGVNIAVVLVTSENLSSQISESFSFRGQNLLCLNLSWVKAFSNIPTRQRSSIELVGIIVATSSDAIRLLITPLFSRQSFCTTF